MLILDNIEGSFSFVSLLKACGKKKDIQKGIKLHGEIVKKGLLGKCPYVATTLISMYASSRKRTKCLRSFLPEPHILGMHYYRYMLNKVGVMKLCSVSKPCSAMGSLRIRLVLLVS